MEELCDTVMLQLKLVVEVKQLKTRRNLIKDFEAETG